MQFLQGSGCDGCGHTGYFGRIGVYELLEVRGELLTALRNEDVGGFSAAAEGDRSFEPIALTALQLAASGHTSLAEVMRIAGGQED
jgi:MSHA biogenesis protein MshE